MVTATETPNILRVSFLVRDTELEQHEVVCFVHGDSLTGGLSIHYAHHVQRSRELPKGSWEQTLIRHELTSTLRSVISTGVMLEMWDKTAITIQASEGVPPTEDGRYVFRTSGAA